LSCSLGGTVANGKQGISWIHEHDMNEIIYQAIVNDKFESFYIASAPNPVSNSAFMMELRNTMKIPFGMPSPAFLVKLGAKLFFNTDPDLVLYGRYVQSERLQNEDFQFKFPNLKEALEDLIN